MYLIEFIFWVLILIIIPVYSELYFFRYHTKNEDSYNKKFWRVNLLLLIFPTVYCKFYIDLKNQLYDNPFNRPINAIEIFICLGYAAILQIVFGFILRKKQWIKYELHFYLAIVTLAIVAVFSYMMIFS